MIRRLLAICFGVGLALLSACSDNKQPKVDAKTGAPSGPIEEAKAAGVGHKAE